MHNPFTQNPVSYSRLASYLECPGCAIEQKRRRREKEPKRYTEVRQSSLFGKGRPDARMVGTLLHTLVNLLHETGGSLTREQQERLLCDGGALASFIRNEVFALFQQAGKLKLAVFFDELRRNPQVLQNMVVEPMLRYQRELKSSGSRVLAAAERFQFTLLSTGKTFPGQPGWGGQVTLVGEFDQVRLRKIGRSQQSPGVPAIMEFKKGLGAKNAGGTFSPSLFDDEQRDEAEVRISSDTLPSMAHAMQLMVYWLAFQTRWNLSGKVIQDRGLAREIAMSVEQNLDLIIYNLNDGFQYQLMPTDYQEALNALTNCIFFLDWSMKSGYSWYAPEHDCKKTQLVQVPDYQIDVGSTNISAHQCYALAREAFEHFKQTVHWEVYPAVEEAPPSGVK